jgi:hypothetical protein
VLVFFLLEEMLLSTWVRSFLFTYVYV